MKAKALLSMAWLFAGTASFAWASGETALGSPAGNPSVSAATDATVMRLAKAFVDTAERIQVFMDNKEQVSASRLRLRAELRKVSMYLEAMREDLGDSVTPAQEEAAVAELRAYGEWTPLADKVLRLWRQTRLVSPLSLGFVAKTIAPDVLPVLNRPDDGEEVPVPGQVSPVWIWGGAAAVVLLVAAIVLVSIRFSRPKAASAKPSTPAVPGKPSTPAVPGSPPAASHLEPLKPTLPEAPGVRLSHGSHGDRLVASTDLSNMGLSLPDLSRLEKSYTLIVSAPDAGTSQSFKLNRRFVSFGRRFKAVADDVSLDLPDFFSRMMGVLVYHAEEEGDAAHWTLALNQEYMITPDMLSVCPGAASQPDKKLSGTEEILRSRDVRYVLAAYPARESLKGTGAYLFRLGGGETVELYMLCCRVDWDGQFNTCRCEVLGYLDGSHLSITIK